MTYFPPEVFNIIFNKIPLYHRVKLLFVGYSPPILPLSRKERRELILPACKQGDLLLLLRINVPGYDHEFFNGLYWACLCNYPILVEVLLNKGVSDLTDGFDVACEEGHLNIVNLLIKKSEQLGIELYVHNGLTISRRENHPEITKILMEIEE